MHPDAKAVLVINPTYFGVCTNLKEIVDLVHSYNIPVLVDEAHGVLIHFHDRLPMSAMQAGADMAATSVHKLGGSLTQSSVLNVKGPRVNTKRIQTIMSMLTTTSTSYILLASLDAARRHLALNGRELAERTLASQTTRANRLTRFRAYTVSGRKFWARKPLTTWIVPRFASISASLESQVTKPRTG